MTADTWPALAQGDAQLSKCSVYGVISRIHDDSAWPTVHDRQCRAYGAGPTVHGIRCMAYSAWPTVHGLRCMTYGA